MMMILRMDAKDPPPELRGRLARILGGDESAVTCHMRNLLGWLRLGWLKVA